MKLILLMMTVFIICFPLMGYAEEKDIQKAQQINEYFISLYQKLYDFIHQHKNRINMHSEEVRAFLKDVKTKLLHPPFLKNEIEFYRKNILILRKQYRDENASFKLISFNYPMIALDVIKKSLNKIDLKDVYNYNLTPAPKRKFINIEVINLLQKEAFFDKTACYIDYGEKIIDSSDKAGLLNPPSEENKIKRRWFLSTIKNINPNGTASIEVFTIPARVTCEFAGLEKEFVYSITIDNIDVNFVKRVDDSILREQIDEYYGEGAKILKTEQQLAVYSCPADALCLSEWQLYNLLQIGLAKQISDWLKKEMIPRGLLKY